MLIVGTYAPARCSERMEIDPRTLFDNQDFVRAPRLNHFLSWLPRFHTAVAGMPLPSTLFSVLHAFCHRLPAYPPAPRSGKSRLIIAGAASVCAC